MDNPAPRYKWRLTWPDERRDHFVGFDGVRKFGMIHAHQVSGWVWFMNWDFPYHNQPDMKPLAGYAETARLAAKAAEDCYDAVIACTWPGMSEADKRRILGGEVGHRESVAMRLEARGR